MSDEYWATFSIYDHRGELYRNALALFDRIVIPIPTKLVGDLTQTEIDMLTKDADFLEARKAAVRFAWDPEEFYAWRDDALQRAQIEGESLAKVLAHDPPYATRIQLSERYNKLVRSLLPKGVDSVVAVPVYGAQERYESATQSLWTAQLTTLEIVMRHMSVPGRDATLEAIIQLRDRPQFRDSLISLRQWLRETVTSILVDPSDRAVREAAADFERRIQQYNDAMTDAHFQKVKTAVISVLAVGAALAVGAGPLVATLAALAPPLFSIQDILKPSWKGLADRQCAPAGVIYALSHM
jgi:hypothetical protein